MSGQYRAPDGYCHAEGCEANYRAHQWGTTKAAAEGWFFQKDGTAWCPEHVPAWVEQWRAEKAEEEALGPLSCASGGCQARHSANRRGAQKKGWFLQKDGTTWCPKHTPDWVAEWRARQAGAET